VKSIPTWIVVEVFGLLDDGWWFGGTGDSWKKGGRREEDDKSLREIHVRKTASRGEFFRGFDATARRTNRPARRCSVAHSIKRKSGEAISACKSRAHTSRASSGVALPDTDASRKLSACFSSPADGTRPSALW